MKINDVQLPKNVPVLGFVIDREHVDIVGKILRSLRSSSNRNVEVLRLLSLWRREQERFGFVVAAFPCDRQSGMLGGLAASWQEAKQVYAFAHKRLDEIAETSPDGFTSMWVGYLTDERRAEWEALSATLQKTVGHA